MLPCKFLQYLLVADLPLNPLLWPQLAPAFGTQPGMPVKHLHLNQFSTQSMSMAMQDAHES